MHRTQNPTASAADTDNQPVVTPAAILRGAARYLELHGWMQTYYCDDTAKPFPPCCAAGAIVMAAYGRWIDIFNPAIDATDYETAFAALADYLNHNGPHPAPEPAWGEDITDYYPEPPEWNDTPGRTAEQVITALRAAADEYDWQHATEDDLETYADACVWREEHPDREGFLAWLGAR